MCTDNARYAASLELHEIYEVVPDAVAAADGDLTVIDESGQDDLYSRDRFVPIAPPAAVRESPAHSR